MVANAVLDQSEVVNRFSCQLALQYLRQTDQLIFLFSDIHKSPTQNLFTRLLQCADINRVSPLTNSPVEVHSVGISGIYLLFQLLYGNYWYWLK
jgi:hypothetical protein